MATDWQIVAFPVILPWRREFWTLPLYFPGLKVGVTPDWPAGLPYQGLPLPPETAANAKELRHYHPGELQQWKAFQEYQETREEVEDIIREIKGESQEPQPSTSISGDPWALAWQLEKMQSDQEAQMVLVDQGQEWLADILRPEPWDEQVDFGQVPGIKEMVDPELARLRYLLWQRVMKPHLTGRWTPLLLGRTSRAIFGTLQDWPAMTLMRGARVPLPGCRSEAEWLQACGPGNFPVWLQEFQQLLAGCLEAAARGEGLDEEAGRFKDWVEEAVASTWPGETTWQWELEIWPVTPGKHDDFGPVLCWAGAGTDILPG